MKFEIDEELKDCITEDWLDKVLSVVPPKMLENLTLRIIEPHWKLLTEKELLNNPEKIMERMQYASSPKEFVAVIKIRKEARNYYTTKRMVALAIYHEIFHANDKSDLNEPRNKKCNADEYFNNPREVRARAFEKKMFRKLKNKREVFRL